MSSRKYNQWSLEDILTQHLEEYKSALAELTVVKPPNG
jgi:hypothetical protein